MDDQTAPTPHDDPAALIPVEEAPAIQSILPPDEYDPHEVTSAPSIDERPANRGCLGWLGMGCFGCLALVGVALVGVLVFSGITIGGIGALFGGILGAAAAPPRASVVSTEALVVGIQARSELVTISQQTQIDELHVSVRDGLAGLCSYSASHAALGTIQAGIDLSRFDSDDVTYDPITNTYTITLPAPHLTSCRVDSIRQYGYSATMCAVDWDGLRMLAQHIALLQMRDQALEGGLLNSAASNAQVEVGTFVTALTDAQVEFVLPDGQPAGASDESCEPPPPLSWVRQGDGSWVKQ